MMEHPPVVSVTLFSRLTKIPIYKKNFSLEYLFSRNAKFRIFFLNKFSTKEQIISIYNSGPYIYFSLNSKMCIPYPIVCLQPLFLTLRIHSILISAIRVYFFNVYSRASIRTKNSDQWLAKVSRKQNTFEPDHMGNCYAFRQSSSGRLRN